MIEADKVFLAGAIVDQGFQHQVNAAKRVVIKPDGLLAASSLCGALSPQSEAFYQLPFVGLPLETSLWVEFDVADAGRMGALFSPDDTGGTIQVVEADKENTPGGSILDAFDKTKLKGRLLPGSLTWKQCGSAALLNHLSADDKLPRKARDFVETACMALRAFHYEWIQRIKKGERRPYQRAARRLLRDRYLEHDVWVARNFPANSQNEGAVIGWYAVCDAATLADVRPLRAITTEMAGYAASRVIELIEHIRLTTHDDETSAIEILARFLVGARKPSLGMAKVVSEAIGSNFFGIKISSSRLEMFRIPVPEGEPLDDAKMRVEDWLFSNMA